MGTAAGRSGHGALRRLPASAVLAGQAVLALVTALADLSDGDRDVLLLVAHAGLTYAEVAQALDLPVGTVRSRLNRARRIVRAALDDTKGTHDDH